MLHGHRHKYEYNMDIGTGIRQILKNKGMTCWGYGN